MKILMTSFRESSDNRKSGLMPRAVRLPPLQGETEMSNRVSPKHTYEVPNPLRRRERRESILTSSDARTALLPIDCVLVYHDQNDDDGEFRLMSRSERRQRFEDYLEQKQGLVLQHDSSKKTRFVKVHTPFHILLQTAEKIRMRLPIEKIDDEDEDSKDIKVVAKSCWHRFKKWATQPFRLDSCIQKNDPDYYTAIYSSKIEKFHYLFDTLRGRKELYFTPSERSLLTHELLARAHSGSDMYMNDDDEDEEDLVERPVVQRTVLNTMVGLKKGIARPGIQRLVGKKVYESYYPLHEPLRENLSKIDNNDLNDREKLQKFWATMRCWLKFQPLSLIRSYMGEKVAFYFAFSGFYNQMLIPAALAGLIVFIYGAASVATDQPTSDICGSLGDSTYMCPTCDKTCPFWKLTDSCVYSKMSYVFDNVGTLVFAIFMSYWSRLFVELWKRRQAVLQYDWDSMDFEENLEPVRPEFETIAKLKGEQRINPITGNKEFHVPSRKRVPFFLIAALAVLLAMAIVCGTVFGTIVYRVQMDYILKQTSVKTYSPIIVTVTSAIINLICSVVLSQLYYFLAKKLTDWELHKFQSTYDDSHRIKIYLFQFVSFYSSLFYIAFFKGRFLEYPSTYGETGSRDFTEQCDPAGCLVELSIQLIIIMIGNQIINTLLELFSATRRTIARTCCNRKIKEGTPQWEIDRDLYDFTTDTLTEEYLELVIQFGFVTLFVVAFPLAPLFALINNLIEIRLDAWKFLSKYKRPVPFKASDIGIWGDIISGISYLAVLTNAIVIAWTSEFIPKMAYRSLHSTGGSLVGYVNWTLTSFPISDYNQTGLMTPSVPDGLTACRYRDFRSPTSPYSYTTTFWNVLAARLAFIVVFEHLIYLTVYILQWLVPDVPKTIQDKIKHERYIDQTERWGGETEEKKFKNAAIASDAVAKMERKVLKEKMRSPTKLNNNSPTGPTNRRGLIHVRISPEK